MSNGSSEDWRVKHLVEAWKTTVEVQRHFNDIELTIRNYALTLLLAVAGAAGVALKEDVKVALWSGHQTSLASVLLFAGLCVHGAFFFMDRFWYHRLLKGAVDYGQKLEAELTALVPGSLHDSFALTAAISRHSPVQIAAWKLHSNGKMNVFYGAIALLLTLGIVEFWHSPKQTSDAAGPCCCEARSR
jgi:hypothetical protein